MKKKTNFWNSVLFILAVSILFTSSCSKDAGTVVEPVVIIPPVEVVTPSAVTSVTPNAGAADTEVIIDGSNFGNDPNAIKVSFGAKNATLISISDTQIKVKVPSDGGLGKVNVVVNKSNSISNKLEFTTQPLIRDLNATTYYNATILISGSDFSPNTADNVVKFGTTQATVISATSNYLRVIAPDLGAATSASVTVTSKGLTSVGKNIAVEADQNKIATYNWTTSTLKSGVIYKTGQFSLFGSTMRRIYVLDITLNASNTLGIGFNPNNATTTAMSTSYGAIGGVNAGYFPLSGASDKDGYVRINGTTIQPGHFNVDAIFTNSALIINKNVASIIKFSAPNKNLNLLAAAIPVADAENIIVCGPILITGNELEEQNLASSHNTSATARTGIGVSADGKRVFMVVVDTGGSVTGVTTPQLGKILQALGAVDAMNLDGGGSSTMFAAGQGDNGRVNFPYGATTQRSVKSIVYVK